MRILMLFVSSALLITSCQQNKSTANDKSFHGVEFAIDNIISVDEMMTKLDENQPLENLIVSGMVEDVCQAKGCWLTLIAKDNAVRVTFKDYGFFVPKNISGKEVIVKGKGQIEITSVEDLQHFAKDEGQSEAEIAKIIEPLEEYTFIAEGVKIK